MAVKKQWYQIMSPPMLGAKAIGETPAADSRQLAGRTLEINAVEVIDNFPRFFVKLRLRITSVEASKANTEFIGHTVMNERIYRMVQRRGRRVDVVQDINTKDGAVIRVKTVFMLIRRVGTSMKDAARVEAKSIVEEVLKDKTLEEIIGIILKNDLQNEVKKRVSKIYPVGNVEVRKTEVLQKVAVALVA